MIAAESTLPHTNNMNQPHHPSRRRTVGPILRLSSLALLVAAAPSAPAQLSTESVSGEVEELASFGGEDFSLVLPTEPINSVFGFGRSLVETPRSATVIGSGLIDNIGIRDGDQLSRIVPGTYTVNRWGIAGATNVRGNNADVYLRGMKRIDPQGNIRNVITMWDSVEIVRGPPSPIFGNGRIGGYVNYVPKSVRGTTGKYLEREVGALTAIAGSYERMEFQLNYAAPLRIGEKEAGYQVFIQGNDSDSYYQQNFQRDRVLQASFSMNLNARWHLETGGIYQKAVNAGQAGANRVTQLTFDNGSYIRGTALVNLDTNGNGTVSEAEIQASRLFPDGTTFTGPRPLTLNFDLPTGAVVPGVPKALQDLLRLPQYAAAAASPAGQAILAAPAGGPLVQGGRQVPIGMFLDPATVGFGERDWSLVAIEEKADGHTYTYYADLIDDADPSATQKVQFLYDYQYQDKSSQLPFNQIQEVTALETKATLTRQKAKLPLVNRLPDWVDLDFLASANIRYTDGGRVSTSGDYDSRRDLITGYTPTDTFTSFLVTGDRGFATGEPISFATFSDFVEYGAGALVDARFAGAFGVIAGARYDYIDANTTEGARYDRFAATGATGRILPARSASGTDDAVSWSASATWSGPLGITPYVTFSEASAVLTASDQTLTFPNVNSGNILGAATLEEAGVKGMALDKRLFYSVAAYRQERSSNVIEEGVGFIRSTLTEGVELELRYALNRNWSFVLSGTWMDIQRINLTGTRTALVTARYLGFQDVTDAAGNVIYPAEAFLFGGNPNIVIPATDARFNKWGQYPDRVFGFFVGYNADAGWGVTWNSTWVDEVAASSEVPDLLTLPSSLSHAASVYWGSEKWRVSLNIRNVFDEEYFAPNSGSFGGTLLQAALPRNYELAVTRRF